MERRKCHLHPLTRPSLMLHIISHWVNIILEVSIIPEWDTFYTKNNKNPKGITCSNIGASKDYSLCQCNSMAIVWLINPRKKVTFVKLHFPWEKKELCIYLYGNWFCFPYLWNLFTLICIQLSVTVVLSSGFITSSISCKLLSYLVINHVDFTKSGFLFSE